MSQFITTQMNLPFSNRDNLCVTFTHPERVILISLSGIDLLPNVLGALFLLLLPSKAKDTFFQ